MRTAVIRVNLDPAGDLPADRLSRAVEALRTAGIEVLAPDFSRVPPHAREIELLVEGSEIEMSEYPTYVKPLLRKPTDSRRSVGGHWREGLEHVLKQTNQADAQP